MGEKGIIQTISVIPSSYPGHSLLTEDEGILYGEDVFMNIGGDSLSIMLLIARLNTDYNYELTLWQIFEDLTIKKLMLYIKQSKSQQ